MALTVTERIGSTGSGASSYTSASFSVTAGNLLIVGYTSGSARDATISDNSGSGSWTSLSDGGATAHYSRWWYKIANGSETTVSFSLIGGTSAIDYFVVEISGWSGTPTLEGSVGEDESNISTAATSSIGAGSVTNSTANAIVLAFFTADQPGLIGDSRSVSDGASYTEGADGNGTDEQVYLFYREVSATGTYTPVYSFTDTGDQVYGASAVFGDVSSGHNVSATTDALTLAEYAATIGKSINVSANVDALTLAEYAATVSLARDVSATVDALTLAEYQATIGLSLNISAGTDALTLAEYPASVGSVTNIAATTDALTLAEYAATIGLSLNVQATTDALTLAEYPASLGSATNVEATTDALRLAEYPATVSFALDIPATTDALTLTEYRATIGDGAITPAVTPAGGGRSKKRRRVMVNGRLYNVTNDELQALLAKLKDDAATQAAVAEALGDEELASEIKRKVVRLAKRVEKVDERAEKLRLLRNEDEQILGLFIDLLAA